MSPAVAGERVVEGRAGEVLKARQRIGAGADGVLRRGHGKADRHPGCGVFIGHGVDAGAAGEHVVAGIAFQRVVERRAGEVLDADEGVAFGIAAAAKPGHQADADAGARGGIARRVDAGAAIQRIGAAKAGEDVVAGIADEHVVERIAGAVDGRRSQQGQVLDAPMACTLSARLKLIEACTVSVPSPPVSSTTSPTLSTT